MPEKEQRDGDTICGVRGGKAVFQVVCPDG